MAIRPTSISFWIFCAITGFFKCLTKKRQSYLKSDLTPKNFNLLAEQAPTQPTLDTVSRRW